MDSNKFVFDNGLILNRCQCMQSFQDWFTSIEHFAKNFQSVESDKAAFVCLCGLSLITGKPFLFCKQFKVILL